MLVRELIAGQVVITARLDDALSEVARRMREARISGMPVVDDWGALAGLVAASDLVRLASPATSGACPDLEAGNIPEHDWSPSPRNLASDPQWGSILARDVIVSELCTVGHEADVREAARKMVNRGVHRAIVLGADRQVCGVVSSLDMARLVATRGIAEP